MLQTLAITSWASVNGAKDQWCGPTGGTPKHLAEKLKDRDERKRKEAEASDETCRQRCTNITTTRFFKDIDKESL